MSVKINPRELETSRLSKADDAGMVFFWKGGVFRAIRHDARGQIEALFSSGLIGELVAANLFPESRITDYSLEGFSLVVEHKKIEPTTYPYEWTFSMLQDAAITVLKVNLIANKYGYQTKDCHGFNVLFDGAQPKFVDLGSFVALERKTAGWKAYEEFMSVYYYPLWIWSRGDDYIARRLFFGGEKLPHYSYLLYRYPLLRIINTDLLKRAAKYRYLLNKVSAVAQSHVEATLPRSLAGSAMRLRETGLLPTHLRSVTSLLKRTKRFSKRPSKVQWADYQGALQTADRRPLSTPRFDRIIEIINRYKVRSVTDLAGNQGVFSRLLLDRTTVKKVICIDYDENAVDTLYKLIRETAIPITPVLQNFVFPFITRHSEVLEQRFKSEAVVALAITHHLLLGQNLAIEHVLKIISAFSSRYVFIEFMPMGLYNGRFAPPVPGWYSLVWFRNALQNEIQILLEEQLEDNRILFVGELKKQRATNSYKSGQRVAS